jgi:pyruvate,water dikinase
MSVISQIPFVTPDMLQRLAGGGGAEALAGTFTRLPRTRFLVRVPVTALTTVLNRLITPARVALWSPRFKTFNRSFAERRLVALTRAELTALWSETDAVFEETGTLMLECSGEFLMAYLLLSFTLKGFLGARAATFESALFSGLSGIRSAEPGLDLLRMAWRIRDMPELRAQVLAADPGKLPDGLKSGNREARSLYSVIEAFLRNHGHRAAREAELSEPRWREDPTFPLAMLRKYVSARNLPDPDKLIATRINTREESTRQALELLPRFVRGPFHLLLRQTQEGARVREEMRNAVVHTMGFYRTLALEVGRRMVEAGCLQRIEDVFFFTKEELLNWLSGSGDMGRLPLLAAQRRWEHQALAALPDLPPWFEMEGDRIVPEQHPAVTGRVLTGLAGSPGVVTGRAVIVNCPGDHAKVGPGDVLVAPYTDVGWTPLFLIAGAVVTELGGPLSHSCVVAREYGVPAVVNVKAATRLLEDGDEVTVDGDKGVVVVKLKDGHVA